MKTPKSLSEAMIKDAETETVDDLLLDELLEEIELIHDLSIKSWVRLILKNADAFWVSSASFIPQSHPPDEMIEGGMILHTKRVVRTIYLLSSTFDCSSYEVDMLIAAALLHDVTKAVYRAGDDREIFHDPMHAYTVDAFVSWIAVIEQNTPAGKAITISDEAVHKILRIIRTSHGVWSQIPETVPQTTVEKLFHIADLVTTNLHAIIDGADINEDRWML